MITGLHLQSISINNGISFNGVTFKTKRMRVKIRSLRFRLWGNTKMTIIDELEVKLYPIPQPRKQKRKASTRQDENDTDSLENDICIYPHNVILRNAVQFLIRRLPWLDLEMRNTTFYSALDYKTTIEYLKYNAKSRDSLRHKDRLKFRTGLFLNNVFHEIKAKNELLTPLRLGSFRVELKFSIDYRSGIIGGFIGKINVSESNISVFNTAKYYILHDELKKANKKDYHFSDGVELDDNETGASSKSDSQAKLEKTFSYIHKLLSDVTIHVENSRISEIPFVTIENNVSIAEYYNEVKPKTSLELVTKSVSFNMSRLYNDAAGFEVLFNPKQDIPFHSTLSIQLFKLFFAKRVTMVSGAYGLETDEILSMPNYSFTHKTNMLSQVVQAKGFKNCVMETFSSASSPIFDVDSRQLSAFLYNIVLFKKWLTLRKLLKKTNNGRHDLDGHKVTVKEEHHGNRESLKAKLWRYINEYYPKLDIKFVVEQPRFILRNFDDGDNTQLLEFSCSLSNFNLSTTSTRDYVSNLEVLYPSVKYVSKINTDTKTASLDPVSKEIFGLRIVNVKLDVFKNLTVSSIIELHGLSIQLTSLDIFKGIHWLLSDVTKLAETDLDIGVLNKKFNDELAYLKTRLEKQIREPRSFEKVQVPRVKDKLFRYLPFWLAQVEIRSTDWAISIGSRSVLIPKQDLFKSDTADLQYDTDDSKELRKVNIKLNSFKAGLVNHGAQRVDEQTRHDSSSSSSDTLTSFDLDSEYWSVSATLEMFQIFMPDDRSTKRSNTEPLIEIPTFKYGIDSVSDYQGRNQLVVSSNMDKLQTFYNRYKLFTLIGSIYLVREFIVTPMKMMKSKLKKDMDKFEEPPESPQGPESRESMLDFIHATFNLETSDIVLQIADSYNLKVQLANTHVELANKTVKLSLFFLRCLADSPSAKGKWCRLLCLDSLSLNFEIPKSIDNLSLDVHTDAIRLIQPHKFIVYELFDNLSLTAKLSKHLIKLLKADDSKEGANIVHPHEMKPIALPNVTVKSNHLKFTMEDDPFETELNMIYQLGKTEQRKRLELYSLFEEREARLSDDKEYFTRLERLHTTISESWMRKVKIYQQQLRDEVIAHKDYLFGNECRFDSDYNKDVVAYPYDAPLLTIGMEGFNLNLSKPDFGLENIADFIHNVGQGVPKNTKYSVMVPMYVDLKLAEMRMQLRDYPLPILYSPRNKSTANASLMLRGDLVISERYVTDEKEIRQLHVPLVATDKEDANRYDLLTIEKTLSSIKMYTKMDCDFNSDYPTRIVWGTSYNFGIQQFMLNFDQFSKPPVDPSQKLGFWDKLKYILHGSCIINTKKSLEVGFKGSRDPYELLSTSGGFVLSFKKNVIWKINKDDNSRNFFDITSDKVAWYIPNYLATPLLAWTRSSIDSVYLPESPHFINTCFGYYLEDSATKPDFDLLNNVYGKNVISLSGGIAFHVGFLLQRKVDGKRVEDFKPHYDVHLTNPKYCDDGHDSYAGFRSEYVHMAISLVADREASYNTIHLSPGAFNQLFAWWKLFASNMMLPIRRGPLFGEMKKSVKFSEHLFTNKFSFYLKSLFIAHMYRDEIVDIDDDRVECVGLRGRVDEFSVDLHQRKQPVTLYHEELSKRTKVMKMNFNIGEVTLSNIDLRVVHASFSQNLYHENRNYNEKESSYNIYGDEKIWFDMQDYEETFLPSLKHCPRTVEIYPLMFSERFSYERDTENDASANQEDDQFGNEDIHDCRIHARKESDSRVKMLEARQGAIDQQITKLRNKGASTKELEERARFVKRMVDNAKRSAPVTHRNQSIVSIEKEEHFHNKFTWSSMLLKWNRTCRDNAMRYLHFVQLKATMRKYLSYESISTLEKFIKENDYGSDIESVPSSSQPSDQFVGNGEDNLKIKSRSAEQTSQERLENFTKILKEVEGNRSLSEDYFIDVVSPQIQLQSDDSPDSVVIVSTPSITGKFISVLNSKDTANPEVLETRFGVVLQDASVFVLNKKDVLGADSMILAKSPYGAKANWPPWLGPEITQRGIWAGENQLLIQNLSVMVVFYDTEIMSKQLSKGNEDTSDANDDSGLSTSVEAPKRLRIDMPSVVLTSTSSQYFALYSIIVSLLFYSEPMSKAIAEKIEKMKFSIDFDNLPAVAEKVKGMQSYFRIMRLLNANYSFRRGHMNNEDLNNYLQLNLETGDVASEIYLLLRTLLMGDFFSDTSNHPQVSFLIKADEVILHILEDDRTPIVDLALANGVYKRKELESGSNLNQIQIQMLQGFNLIKNARYPDFIGPFDLSQHSSKNLIDLQWTMNRSVGGIKVVENLQVNALPLNIKVDEITGEKLMKFIFQTDSTDIKESKVIEMANNTEAKEKELEDPSEQDQYGLVEETEGANKSARLDRKLQERSMTSSRSNKRSLTRLSGKSHSSSKSSNGGRDDEEDADQVNEMIERSKQYFSIISLTVRAITLRITIKLNKGYKRLLNVHDFRVELPELVIKNRILSFIDLTDIIKKLVLKSLWSHIGRLLSNKMTTSDKSSDMLANEKLMSVKTYNKFIPIRELAVVRTKE
ncbi:FMP27 [Candida theae]|uniref:FMP27 n=1 Tax=Candida theae TaxID=1198502 RepID=A0AAD5BID0_9ASCO|nr:FMP27 [Candida theae]KAI5964489.1 FMP27 [Candida theae]